MLFLAATAAAQDPLDQFQPQPQTQPKSQILIKGLSVTAGSEFSYDDNILRQQNNPIGSRLWQFSPKMRYSMQTAGGVYSLSYDVNYTDYLDSSQDTNLSQTVGVGLDQKLNSYNKITLSGTYNHSYEGRGVGFNEGSNALNLSSPTPLVITTLLAKYQLGAEKSKLRFTGTLGRTSYDRSSPSIINDSRDYHEDQLGALLDYRLGPRIDLVGEWRDRQIGYSRTPVAADGTELPLDSEEQMYLVGLDLAATAKTTGKLRVGTVSRDFKWKAAQWEDMQALASNAQPPVVATTPANFPTDTGAESYWEFSATWAPVAYSKFEFDSHTSSRESLGVGSFARSRDYTMSWTHQWKRRLRSRLDLSIGTDTYENSSRVDDRKAYNLRIEYDFDDLISVGFGYTYNQMSSTANTLGFDKSVYYIFANYHNRNGG